MQAMTGAFFVRHNATYVPRRGRPRGTGKSDVQSLRYKEERVATGTPVYAAAREVVQKVAAPPQIADNTASDR